MTIPARPRSWTAPGLSPGELADLDAVLHGECPAGGLAGSLREMREHNERIYRKGERCLKRKKSV